MPYRSHNQTFYSGSIDAKTTGATKIATTENGSQRFIPKTVIIELTAATAVTVVATLSVGTNSATYNNILAATALTGLSALNNIVMIHLPATAISSIAPNTDIYVNVTIGATATTANIRVDVDGYYI
jgi:hypothetical protein